MKRDMDLVRQILLTVENHDQGYAPESLLIDGYTEEQIGYHCYLLVQAGLAEGVVNTPLEAPSPSAILLNLTWQGHEFAASAQSPTIWSQAKDVMHKVGDGSFQVWQGVLTDVVKSSLGVG